MPGTKREYKLIPPWNMPSDPVKAVFWFLRWFLRVLVRFFWILVLAGVTYETILNSKVGGIANGIVSGIVTLLVLLGVWIGLALVLFFLNITMGISRAFSEVNRVRQGYTPNSPFSPFVNQNPDIKGKVVEGTITDLEEERRKRRREN
jgi:hypothetical protein